MATMAAMQQVSRGRAEASSVAYRSAQAVVWMGDFNYRIDLDRCGICFVRSSMICL
jgi:endonuclease/exonuclease/phosphatase family metal-dependent hydrolase